MATGSGTVYSSWSSNWKPSGSSVNKQFRTWLNYSYTNYSTYVSITLSMGIQLNSSVGATFTSSYIRENGTNKYTAGSNKTVYKSSGAQLTWTWISSRTFNVARGTTATTKTYTATCTSSSASWNQTLTTSSVSIPIPALESYAVTYDANGGTGTMANQTKYYGQNLTLESSGVSRQYHTLIGWNTKADGSGTAYALGATYSANAALSLYAQWRLNYTKPTITSFDCYRVDSSSSTAESMGGEYIRIIFDYTGGSITDGASYIAPSCKILINDTQVYSGTLNASGTYVVNYGTYTANSGHVISVQLYDSYDATGVSVSDSVGSAQFPIDILGDGSAMGIMTPAVSGQTLKLYVDAIYPVGSYYETSDTSFNPNTYFGGTWVEVDGTFVNGVDVAVNITSYTSSDSPYVFPSNGVIKLACGYEAGNSMQAQILDADDISNVALVQSSPSSYAMKSSQHVQAVVYKGQRCYCTKTGSSSNSTVYFFPYTYSTKRWHRTA